MLYILKKLKLDKVQSYQNEEKGDGLGRIPLKSFSWLYSLV